MATSSSPLLTPVSDEEAVSKESAISAEPVPPAESAVASPQGNPKTPVVAWSVPGVGLFLHEENARVYPDAKPFAGKHALEQAITHASMTISGREEETLYAPVLMDAHMAFKLHVTHEHWSCEHFHHERVDIPMGMKKHLATMRVVRAGLSVMTTSRIYADELSQHGIVVCTDDERLWHLARGTAIPHRPEEKLYLRSIQTARAGVWWKKWMRPKILDGDTKKGKRPRSKLSVSTRSESRGK